MATRDLKSRLRATFTRRRSATPSVSSADVDEQPQPPKTKARSLRSLRSLGGARPASNTEGRASSPIPELTGDNHSEDEDEDVSAIPLAPKLPTALASSVADPSSNEPQNTTQQPPLPSKRLEGLLNHTNNSSSTTDDLPTPGTGDFEAVDEVDEQPLEAESRGPVTGSVAVELGPEHLRPSRPLAPPFERRQSLLPQQQTTLIKTLLEIETGKPALAQTDYFTNNGPTTISPNMVSRKIWVKRPNASATLVTIHEDDLVDDVRDMILKKYANSLGKNFDAPDVTLRICPREQRQDRVLGPEEPMSRTLDAYFAGGQTVEEALVIDVPHRRTPKPSPRTNSGGYYHDELRPGETGSDYFPPMPVPVLPSPNLTASLPVAGVNGHIIAPSHAISVLTTGHVPNLPSPGGTRRRYGERPRAARHHTSSPTVVGSHVSSTTTNGTHSHSRVPRSRAHSSASDTTAPPVAPSLPTPPVQDAVPIQRVATPPRVSSPRPTNRVKKSKKNNDHPNLPAGLLNGAVPPINVLIVEDNIINLKLLEAFMKRLKVRWQTAMNGKEAVTKWRAGGFHLVLMDIQLPVMNGLDATREIRRLEKLNSIGVFSSSASSSAPEQTNEPEGDDRLPSTVLFKSPVIIVALTASSLQSDRHEALAAGCNDFLTKPVNFVWLERKVMEWGCMQALIDFDGWRKWKDFSQGNDEREKKDASKTAAAKAKAKRNRNSLGSASALPGSGSTASVAGTGSGAGTTTERISEEI